MMRDSASRSLGHQGNSRVLTHTKFNALHVHMSKCLWCGDVSNVYPGVSRLSRVHDNTRLTFENIMYIYQQQPLGNVKHQPFFSTSKGISYEQKLTSRERKECVGQESMQLTKRHISMIYGISNNAKQA